MTWNLSSFLCVQPYSETRWWWYAVGWVWNWESHEDGRNHKERRIREDFERKPQASSSKTGSGSSLCLLWRQWAKYTSLLVKDDIQKFKMNVTDWIEHPTSVPEDHQNWRKFRDVLDMLKGTTNDWRLLSSKKDKQLTVSIRGANKLDPGSFWFLWNLFLFLCVKLNDVILRNKTGMFGKAVLPSNPWLLTPSDTEPAYCSFKYLKLIFFSVLILSYGSWFVIRPHYSVWCCNRVTCFLQVFCIHLLVFCNYGSFWSPFRCRWHMKTYVYLTVEYSINWRSIACKYVSISFTLLTILWQLFCGCCVFSGFGTRKWNSNS